MAKIRMKRIIKRCFWIILLAGVLAFHALSAWAAEPPCGMTVRLENEEKQGLDGIEVQICRVADAQLQPTPDFEDAGVSFSVFFTAPDDQNAKKLVDYIQKHTIATQRQVTQNGTAVFNELSAGIWVVYSADVRYTFNPYIVILPFSAGDEMIYHVTSTPKAEEKLPDHKSIYVVKKWEDEADAAKKRPDSITIRLLKDEAVIQIATLSEANGWNHTFQNLPDSGVYRVEEQAVALYKSQYGGDAENGFVITNVYQGEKLPQTGQYWWPIAILAVAGVSMVLLGVLELRGKKHEKK